MSSVVVTDKRGGVYQVVVTFTYGECDRLPYNAMRKVNARIEQVRGGGIKATAEFNVRSEKEAANLVEVLDLFGEDGSFVHGSAADPEALTVEGAPDDNEAGIRSATAGEERGTDSEAVTTAPSLPKESPSDRRAVPTPREEADDLEVEGEEDVEVDEGADDEPEMEVEDWQALGDMAVVEGLAAGDHRDDMLKRVREAAGKAYDEARVSNRLLHLLYAKHKNEKKVAALMEESGWSKVTPKEVGKALRK